MFFYLLLTFLFAVFVYCYFATKRPKSYPPGPRWLPIVGNTWSLRSSIEKYGSQMAVFQAWQLKYKSNVLGLKLGKELVVVALTHSIIDEVHNSDVFDGRPDNFFIRLRSFGSRLGITFVDGDLWWRQKKFISRFLRCSKFGRAPMDEVIQCEMNQLRERILEECETPIWPGKFFSAHVMSILWTITAGERLSYCNLQLTKLMELLRQRSKVFDLSGGWLNALPFLRFIAPEKTSYNLIKQFNSEVQKFLLAFIGDHKKRFSNDTADDDLIFAFIGEMNRANGDQTNFTDDQLVMVLLDIFIAGSQSTSYTLDYIMLMMALNPDIQQKCASIIDEAVGKTQPPSMENSSELLYIEAMILETQRFCNVAPIGGPRRATRDTKLDGYLVPKDATVLIGLETINNDIEYWGDPHVYRPERFLNENNRIVNTERLAIYARGRRRCPGEAIVRAILFNFTVGILQKFKLEISSNGKRPGKRDFRGLFTSPAPYEIVFKVR